MLEIISLKLAIIAYVYAIILTDDEMLLFHWKGFLYRTIGSKKRMNWLFKILVDCEYCVGGQMALWTYLGMWFFQVDLFGTTITEYSWDDHVWLVALTILLISTIKRLKIYEK